jgi:class 3 adenylate cyclase/tetratricopeptide (TPR) repeat protein
VVVCSACGRENPEDARFCNGCGAPLAEEARVREERKVVTAVFVDLVGSTARAERLDPEDVRTLLRRYHETLRRELERHGGTVEKFIGDAVVAVYGAPTAHEDDPERAVRAALAVRDAIRALDERDDALDLHVRVGVATGEALVALDARPATGEWMVAGDVMNTAARIQAAAPVDGILVGAATQRATERLIVYEAHDPVEAKGKSDPVPVWLAVEPVGRVGEPAGDPASPLVGREHERALLLGAFARVRVDRSPQLVTLVGVPGIGKSRLVAELGRAVVDDEEIITWRYGRCLPYGDGVTFWALGEVVKAQAGIHENDSGEEAERKLSAMIDELVPETERRRMASSLRPLVGLAPEDTGLADRRAELATGWRSFLEVLAERRPLVVVFDDLQWADEGMLDFVDELVELVEDVPMLVVCCARPELLERRPEWGGGKRNALTVSLAPLTADETHRLVESLLGRDPADDELRASVVERAGGNPLYAEEFVRMQASGGATSELPDTVLGIVTARVDLLPPAEKELLRDAAVMGGVVWSDGLRAVSGHDRDADVGELLRSLGRKEFLRRERHSAVAGATQHAFVHGLVRDAVYAQLPRPDRVERHVRVARWIESLPDDRREDRSELLAHHYVQAIELSRSAGLDAADLQPAAAAALREAGLRAFAVGAPPACVRALRAAADWSDGELDAYALRVLGKALVFTEQSGREELLRAFDIFLSEGANAAAAAVAVDLAHSLWQKGDGHGAAEWAARGVELIEGQPPSRDQAHVLAQLARLDMLAGRTERATELAGRAIDVATSVGAEASRASALITQATCRANTGDYENVREDLEEARRVTTEYDPTEVSRAYVNLSSILLDFGDLADAIAVAREGLAHNVRAGTAGGTGGFAAGNLCEALFFAGHWEEAEAVAIAELDRALKVGGLYYEPFFRLVLAELGLVRFGRVEEAAETARQGVELGYSRGDDQSVFPSLATAAWTLARTGSVDEARALLDDLLARRRRNRIGVLPGYWTIFASLTAELVGGLRGALASLDESRGPRFLEAALEVDAGRFAAAARTLREIGAPQLEAEALVLASRDGDRDALARARKLLGELGATARLRELEAEISSRSGGS